MALVTLCPNCGATFRVRSSQLQAHNGDVRCGCCHQVFNGYTTLITVDESEIVSPFNGVDAIVSESHPPASDLSKNKELPLSSYLNREGSEVEEGIEEPAQIESKQTEIPTESYQFDAIPPRKSRLPRVIAGLFLLLMLVGQALYVYRTELSIIVPGMKPFLERYCAILSCTIPLPQDLNLLNIESSELRVASEQQPEVTKLTVTIRNYASFPQALPALELILTNIHDEPLATRIFTKDDYFNESADVVDAIAPDQEIDIKLSFISSDVKAVGYRLFLFYP